LLKKDRVVPRGRIRSGWSSPVDRIRSRRRSLDSVRNHGETGERSKTKSFYACKKGSGVAGGKSVQGRQLRCPQEGVRLKQKSR